MLAKATDIQYFYLAEYLKDYDSQQLEVNIEMSRNESFTTTEVLERLNSEIIDISSIL